MPGLIKIILRVLGKIEFYFSKLSNKLSSFITASKLLKKGETDRDLYKTMYGDYFWLNGSKYIDNLIIRYGIFEEWSTRAVKKIVKENDTVIDIGANTGYYSVILSKLVGRMGKVYAFEPISEYREILKRNLEVNRIKNCEILNYGLSNQEQELTAFVNESSATIHPLDDNFDREEKINLTTLNDFAQKNNFNKIDFIKIDVDGHEPAVLEGAWEAIRKYRPVVLLEISHLHYLKYGITAWDFYCILKKKDFYIYSEVGMEEIKSQTKFLIKCSNFNHSTNIIISHIPITL